MNYEIMFEATVTVRQNIEADSMAEAEMFARTVLDGEAIADAADLFAAIDPDSLIISDVITVKESQNP